MIKKLPYKMTIRFNGDNVYSEGTYQLRQKVVHKITLDKMKINDKEITGTEFWWEFQLGGKYNRAFYDALKKKICKVGGYKEAHYGN